MSLNTALFNKIELLLLFFISEVRGLDKKWPNTTPYNKVTNGPYAWHLQCTVLPKPLAKVSVACGEVCGDSTSRCQGVPLFFF